MSIQSIIIFLLFCLSTATTNSLGKTNETQQQNYFVPSYQNHLAPSHTNHRRRLPSISCDAGTVNRLNSANCADCLPGFYSEDASTWMVRPNCIKCPIGKYQNEYGQAVCEKCDLGQFSNLTARGNDCEKCATGKYGYRLAGEDGAIECEYCPTGYHAEDEGSSVCEECVLGKFAKDEGQKDCVGCEEGWYTDQTGQLDCKACVPGKFQSETGKQQCEDCLAGTYSSAQAQFQCNECELGRYSQNGQSKCLHCRDGQYQVS